VGAGVAVLPAARRGFVYNALIEYVRGLYARYGYRR
jgi:hypothetical protein